MKIFNKNNIVLLATLATLGACAELDHEVKPGFEYEKPGSVIVDENVSRYDVLKSYVDGVILGAKASLEGLSNPNMISLLSTNFEQVTPSSSLNPNVLLLDDGTYDFSAINNYINIASEKGLSVYGDHIVTNTNQNTTYLNTVGAPLTYLTPLYPNLINIGSIKDETFSGWELKGDVSVEDYMGELAVKMENGASMSTSDATSLQSPVYTVDEGARFEMTFYLLSTKAGEGRVVFNGLNNNEPEMDWIGTGSNSETFTTKIGWNKIQFRTDDFDGSGEFSFKIELGYTANVTYYMNVQGLSLVNLNGSVDNPDEIFLEAEDAQQVGQWMVSELGDAATISGGEALAGIINGVPTNNHLDVGTPADPSNQDYQFTYSFTVNTTGEYRLWVRQKAYAANGGHDSFFLSVDGAPYFVPGWPAWGDDSNTTNWTWMQLYTGAGNIFNFEAGKEHTISIKIREGGHYFDRFYITMTSNVPSGLGSAAIAQSEVTLEVSEEVHKAAIEEVLENYIATVTTNLSDKIGAWTVVKDPFAEDGNVAMSGGVNTGNSFYWADIIGEEYIEQAFSTAREYVSEGTKLFIGESDLNTNTDKLNAVIYTASNNSDIDGVAISLNLDLETDLDLLGDMFDDLAASGKLVYISDLRINVSEHTAEVYALQSEAYQKVVSLYMSKVPASQQYGITLSDPVSNNAGLWDSDYNRKHPYAGFSIGLGAQEQ